MTTGSWSMRSFSRLLGLDAGLPECVFTLLAQRLLVLVEAGLHPPVADLDVATVFEQIVFAFSGGELQRRGGLLELRGSIVNGVRALARNPILEGVEAGEDPPLTRLYALAERSELLV